MPGFTVKKLSSETVAENTEAFQFDKPAGFKFKAGQFVNLAIENSPFPDPHGDSRPFSLASAPSEPFLLFATRMTNAPFKRALKAIPPGTELKMRGPFGSLTLPQNAGRTLVMLAGGIGITPFRSMAVEAAALKIPTPIFLIYSNRAEEAAAFLNELKKLEVKNPNYRLIPSYKQIDRKMIEDHVEDFSKAFFYIAGPPGMVRGMQILLDESGVMGENIVSEEFEGYK